MILSSRFASIFTKRQQWDCRLSHYIHFSFHLMMEEKSENLQTQFVSWINFSPRFITFFFAILKILHFFCRWLCNCVSVPLKKRRRLLTYVLQRLKYENENLRKQRKWFGRQIEKMRKCENRDSVFFLLLRKSSMLRLKDFLLILRSKWFGEFMFCGNWGVFDLLG